MSSTLTPIHPLENSKTRLNDLTQHPLYDPKSKRPIPTYVLRQEHPSWPLPVVKDKRVRTGGDYQDYFSRFVQDVRARGVQQPVIAVRRGEFGEIVDGETRRQAALLAGLATIPILLFDQELTESDLVFAQLQANAQRRDFSELELAGIYLELMKLNSWNQATLAKNIHVSPAQVSRILSISLRLCDEARNMVAAGDLAPRAAYALSKLNDPSAQMELAKQFKDGVLCVEGVESQVGKLLGKKAVAKPKPLKLTLGEVNAEVTGGNILEALKNFIAKVTEAIRKIERDGADPAYLAALLKGN